MIPPFKHCDGVFQKERSSTKNQILESDRRNDSRAGTAWNPIAAPVIDRHVAVGTVSSIDNHQVVINENVKGKERPMAFMIAPSTKEAGNLQPGSRVAVHYRYQHHERVATSIRQHGRKTSRVG